MSILVCSLGLCLLAWAALSPAFRDGEGFLTKQFCLAASCAVAAVVWGVALRNRCVKSASWFSLALVGQAAALQIIDAGPAMHYQHYRVSPAHFLALFLIALQTVLVIVGIHQHVRVIGIWIKSHFARWQVLALALTLSLFAAAGSKQISSYASELALASFVQLVNAANLLLIVWNLPKRSLAGVKQRIDRLVGSSRDENVEQPGRIDHFALIGMLWVILAAGSLSFFVYERHPHIPDEVVYLYHARYLAEGKLVLPAPPVPDAFLIDLMNYEKDRWFCPVPPGWPAVLAMGVLLGIPWLVNPVLAGLNILLVYLFLQEIYSRRIARLSVLLLCASPWYIFMAMNWMTHTLTLTCAFAAAVALAWCRRSGRARWAWLAGFASGAGSLVRPLDGVIVLALLGLWVIGVGGRRLKAQSIVAFVASTVLVGALALPYNWLLTGDPTVSPIMAYTDKYYGPKTNALGFGPERGLGWPLDAFPGHTPAESVINATLNFFSLNIELFGWSTGSLMLASIVLFSKSISRSDYKMLAIIGAVLAAYSLFYFSGGPDFGARYWYLIIIPCVALTVRGIQFLESACDNSPRPLLAILCLSGMALVNYFPWRAIDKYHRYLGMRPDVRRLSAERNFGRSLVLVRGDLFPDYASAVTYNPVDLQANEPIYAWDRNPDVRAKVMAAYSDRPVWFVDGPSLTRGGFKVVAGPLAYTAVLNQQGQ